MLRARLLQLIRRLGLSHALDRLRYHYHRWRNAGRNRAFRKQHPDFALPPDYLMYESFRLDYAAYQRTGREAAEWISDHFRQHQPALNDPTMLDWGCGPGRVLRHLPAVFGRGGQYWGADPNPSSVQWCADNLGFAGAVASNDPGEARLVGSGVCISQLAPPLPFPARSSDLLYGISIFTHLSAPAHADWLVELGRVLKPGGMALLTTHGVAYRVKLTPAERDHFDQGDLVIRGGVREGHRVFTAYHPPATFQRLVTEQQFAVLTHRAGQEKAWGIEQDTWVVKKV